MKTEAKDSPMPEPEWLLVKLPMRQHDPWPWLEELIAWNVANGARGTIGEWRLPEQGAHNEN